MMMTYNLSNLLGTVAVASTDLVVVAVLAAAAPLDLTSVIPIGTVTGMLAIIFTLFIRDSARNDTRADVTNAKLVAAAESERDRAIEERDAERIRHEKELLTLREDALAGRVLLQVRITQLETELYGERRTEWPPE